MVFENFQSQVARDCEVVQAKKVLDSMKADYREVWSGPLPGAPNGWGVASKDTSNTSFLGKCETLTLK